MFTFPSCKTKMNVFDKQKKNIYRKRRENNKKSISYRKKRREEHEKEGRRYEETIFGNLFNTRNINN